jgi:uncharacterized protein (UPF0276 family)
MTHRDRSLAGIGLKPAHVRTILAERPPIGLFEIHAENYMGEGGPPHRHLAAIRAQYPLSIHVAGQRPEARPGASGPARGAGPAL